MQNCQNLHKSHSKSFLKGIVASIALFLFCAVSAKAQSAMSGTYTVCSSNCDFSNLQSAINALKKNGINGKTTISIKAGSYNEQISLPAIVGSSATNVIVIQGAGRYGTNKTRIFYNATNVFSILSAKYITLSNLSIESQTSSGASYPGTGALHLVKCENIRIQDCRFFAAGTNNYDYAIYAGSCINNIYENNRIEGSFFNNAYDYSASILGKNDTVRNNSMVAGVNYGYYCYYGTGNQFYNNTIDSSINSSTVPIYSNYENGAAYFNNHLNGNNYGIYLANPNGSSTKTPFVISNNFISSIGYYGITGYDYSGSTKINVRVIHNTVYLNYTGGYNFYMYNYYGSSGWDVRNNNFYNEKSAGSVLYFYKASKYDFIDGNNYYASGGKLVNINGYSFSTLVDYQQYAISFGFGKFDQNIKTTFKSPPYDLHYPNASLFPWGKNVGIVKDIDGDSRCLLFPTSGADEGNQTYSKPTSAFKIPNKVVANTKNVFVNLANSKEPHTYKWYIDGKFVSDSLHLVSLNLNYPSVKIALVTESCAGKDSVVKTINVDTATAAPITDFIANTNKIKLGESVSFNDLSMNYPSQWEWSISPKAYNDKGLKTPTYQYISGDSTQPDIKVKFVSSGKFQICLNTSNKIGKGNKECKVNYIEVQSVYKLSSNNTIIKDDNGFIYDDGGEAGIYSSYTKTSALIAPYCAKNVYLVFKYFSVDCGYDFMRLWDGEDANTGIEITKCLTNIYLGRGPGLTGGPSSTCYSSGITCVPLITDTFVAKSGKMYISFETGYNNYSTGFEAYFWSDLKSQNKPESKFSIPDTICTNANLNFISSSKGADLRFLWDLDGDDSYFEETATSFNKQFTKKGDYPITLITYNCAGSDTFRKVLHVVDPPTPIADFTADNLAPTTNDVVFLIPHLKSCVDYFQWTITKTSGPGNAQFINGTNAYSEAPQIILSDTGCYTIYLKVSNVSGKDSIAKVCYLNAKSPYCIPSVKYSIQDIGISNVKVATLENKSSQTGGYENYISKKHTVLEIGVTYPFTVQRITNANKVVRTLYIDWNADSDFNDTLEKVAQEIPGYNLDWLDTFTVPVFVRAGTATVMRVAINQGNKAVNPCFQDYGEYEDYRIYFSLDKTPPIIKLKGADTIYTEQGYPFNDPGAIATDNLSGNITAFMKITYGGFNNFIPGTYTFTYNVSDPEGNAALEKRRVVIVTADSTPPSLEIYPDDTIFIIVGEKFTPPTYTAIDLVNGDLTANVQTNISIVKPNVVDTFLVSYVVTDGNQNTAEKIIPVIVLDTTAPVLTLQGDEIMYHNVNTVFYDPGVEIYDNYYNFGSWVTELQNRLVKFSNINVNKLGTYTIIYNLKDPSDNEARPIKRTVIVHDTLPPTLTLIGDEIISLEVGNVIADQGISIHDNYYQVSQCTLKVSGTFYSAFPDGRATTLGKYNIVYVVIDGSGNLATIIREINVLDTQPPEIKLLGNIGINICLGASYTDSGYIVSDNYWSEHKITVTPEGSFLKDTTSKEGLYYLRYKVTDGSGNTDYSDWRIIMVLPLNSPNCITGISAKADLENYIKVYPNPSTGQITLENKYLPTQRLKISVIDVLGKKVYQNEETFGDFNKIMIDFSDKKAGIYTLNVFSESGVIRKKILIQR